MGRVARTKQCVDCVKPFLLDTCATWDIEGVDELFAASRAGNGQDHNRCSLAINCACQIYVSLGFSLGDLNDKIGNFASLFCMRCECVMLRMSIG